MGNNEMGYLLFLKTITPLHIGSSETGIIDRPIQRDHLRLPIIFGSSIKGSLRHQINWDNDEIKIFGSSENTDQNQPGSIIFLDARPLFIPVRSLFGTYAYVTSPYLLNILKNYAEVAGIELKFEIPDMEKNEAIIINKGNRELEENGKVYLNETEFELKNGSKEIKINGLEEIIKNLGLEKEPIVLVSDKSIVELVNSSLIIYWRNRLEKDRKVVKLGGLWCEEYVPENTIFVSGFVYVRYKLNSDSNENSKNSLIETVKSKIKNEIINIGGLETIGKGLVKLIIYPNKNDSS